jgi:NAD(P)-dependent dehydrogenase (short-subunit alcohol dehydrogenase family)
VKETVDEVKKAGGVAEAMMADAGSEQDVMAVIDKAVKTHGRLDVIWANAGVSGGLVPLGEQTVEQWQEVLRINLIGPFLAVKHAMPHMVKQQSGAIVLTASVAGLIETGMTKPIFDRAKERGTADKIGQLNPLKRPGQPHELAAMGLFLASDEASYVNGQAFPVDGGLTASMPYTGKPV